MSAQALLSLPNNAIIQSETSADNTGSITFNTPFPKTPLIFLQNAQGSAWDQVTFVVGSVSTTGFTYLRFDTQSNTNVTSTATQFNYVAIGFP